MNVWSRWLLLPTLFMVVCSLACQSAPPTAASRLGDIPITAEFRAGLRAIAALDPDEKIRNPDAMARQFLSDSFWFWSSLDPDYAKSQMFIKAYRVNGYYTANASTKHIDAILEKAAARGFDQVVNIGSELDSRPYRFRERMPAVRFFELDLPATVACKKELVAAALGGLPENVRYIPVDYRGGAIETPLKQAGYDAQKRTLFICEDALRYIDGAAVERVFEFIAANAAAGSELVFDYIPAEIVHGDFSKYPRARFHSIRMAAYGHPWKFGIAMGKAADFVTARGLNMVSDLGAGELAQRYLVRKNGQIDGQPTAYFRIMHAVLK